jgi:hypothetical protein
MKLSAALLLVLVACADSAAPTQTIVAIDAEPAIKASIERVAVVASSASGDAREERSFDDGVWPVRLVLSPRGGDAARRFQLEVVAYGEGDKKLIGFSFGSGYVAKASRYALIMIEDECAAATADSCIDSSCNHWQPDASELGSSRIAPWKASITCAGGMPAPGGLVTIDAGTVSSAATGTAGQPADMNIDAGTTHMPPTSTDMTGMVDMGPCDQGFVRSEMTCVDVDECMSNVCGEHGSCENLTPGYLCHCDTGYEFDNTTCVDTNECATDNGGCADTCVDDEGGAHCACGAGAWLKPDGKGCAKLTPPEKLSTSASTVQCFPQVSSDAAGNGVAAWMQGDGTHTSIWTDRYVAGQGWMGATKFPTTADVDADSPQIVLDAQGRGFLVWIQSGDTRDLWAARYTAGTFSAPAKIETNDDAGVILPSAAMDGSGNGYVVWTYSYGSRFEVWGSRLYGSTWLAARKLAGSETVTAGWGRIRLDDKGRGLMVWSQADITDASADNWSYAPYARRFDPSTLLWSTPFNLDDSGQAALPDVRLNGDGSGVVVWQRRQDSRVIVLARAFDPAGTWADAVPLSAAGSELWPTLFPSVALSPSHAAAIWSEKQGSAYRVWASDARDATEAWSKSPSLSPADSAAEAVPAIALDPQGAGFGVWSDIDASNARKLYALRVHADSGFDGTPIEVASDVAKGPVSPAALSFDAQGDALVVWDTQVPTSYEVRARRFE